MITDRRQAPAQAGYVGAELLDEARTRRLEAVASIALQPAAIFALRSALVLDEDAEVRTRAAERLGTAEVARAAGAVVAAVGEAVCDALRDGSPAVREAAARAAGRLREARAEAQLVEMIRLEPAWSARRAAARALAAVAGERAAPALAEVLDDPFWRVRYAAIQALARWPGALVATAPGKSPRWRAAAAYLEAVWRGERAAALPPPEPARVEPDPDPGSGLGDDDPAVTAARLAAAAPDAARGAELVAHLANPHASLRRIAARRLVERGRPDELLHALDWLEDPRVPYATEAVKKLLRRADGRALADAVLARRASGPGALAWALEEAARRRHGAFVEAAREGARHDDVRVRRAAARALAEGGAFEALRPLLDDADDAVRAEAVGGVAAAAEDPAAAAALAALADRAPHAGGPLAERALVGAARLWAARDPDAAWAHGALRAALASAWSDVRAQAVAELAWQGRLAAGEIARAAADPDPWIRAAALDAGSAPDLLERDPDPSVRRAAAAVLSRLRAREQVTPDVRRQVGLAAARSDDPWVRARAADLLDPEDDAALAALLCLTRDPAPMARAAAADAVERCADREQRCARLLAQGAAVPEDVRLAAHAQALRRPDARAFDALVRDIDAPGLSPAARETLRAMTLAYPDPIRARAPAPAPTPAPAPAPAPTPAPAPASASARAPAPAESPPPRRALGKTGLHVAPLGLSGAFDLPAPCLEDARAAGVNLFFWEPEYRTLGEFLSRARDKGDLVIAAGSYEADPRSIERDVERALARLRIDAVGVFLLFWVRSRARLSDEAFATLERLKRDGKIRAMGFSTHLRDLAAEAIAARPWDVVMCRLSAAHPGAERALLPAAAAAGTGVLAFSALLYGRLLADPRSGDPVPAADCYRYALSQPGVSACLSAPRRRHELLENLEVLRRPTLDEPGLARMRAHGARAHAENRAFQALVRQPV